MRRVKIIITGATGFVGEGVLMACLWHPQVSQVLMINRKHDNLSHPKLKELILPDFFQAEKYSEEIKGYDACFYCAGKSSAGLSKEAYHKITYDTTLAFAHALLKVNPALVFCFVSGSHSNENSRAMWARIKGKTENALMRLPFMAEYNFRPGAMVPTAGQRHIKKGYRFIVRLLRSVVPKRVSTLQELGLAMIVVALQGYSKQVLEIDDIKKLVATPA